MQRIARGLAAAFLLALSGAAGAAEVERPPEPAAPAAGAPARLPASIGLPSLEPGLVPMLGSEGILPAETLLSLSPEAQAKMAVVIQRAAPAKTAAAAPAVSGPSLPDARIAPGASPADFGKAGAVIEEVLAGFSLKDLQELPQGELNEVFSRLVGLTAVPGTPRGHTLQIVPGTGNVSIPVPHEHEHGLADPAAGRKVLIVNGVTLLLEAAGAIVTGSSALAAEAMHNAVDVGMMAALLISPKLARFGLDPERAEAKMSLLIAGAILATVVETAWQAARHLLVPVAGPGGVAIAIAVVGLINAAVSLALLRRGAHSDGLRTLIAHFVADTIGALGIIASGVLQLRLGWTWADPVTGFLIAGLVVWVAVPLLIRSLKALRAK